MKTSAAVVEIAGDRLKAAIGIDPRGLDGHRLLWIVKSRCRELGLAEPSEYARVLDERPGEIDALIDEAVVRETRFFRDPVVFEHIRQAIAQIAAMELGPLRILSAPCGTGEEAYSLAAMLELAGLAPARYSIDAVDVSNAVLEIAGRGVYAERALSLAPLELQQACATRRGKHWVVHESLRERIRFSRRNLAEAGALGEAAQYHLILCRNLFIYLAPAARAALAQSLSKALLPEGRLFLGTADRVEELNALFAPVRPAASFSFVHRGRGVSVDRPVQVATQVRSGLPEARGGRPRIAFAAGSVSVARPQMAADSGPDAMELLNRALEHRQRGELSKAERRCRQALYVAPNLLPALELLQSLWSEHPNLRLRRALRDRVLRNRLLEPAAFEAATWKENA
jgi:chemotaxis protein methyltransferase WspC